jgi:VIT1/CCC1 family predicted Fe2+/Mn2+ transporter
MTEEEANTLAERIMQDPKVALDTMAREELGIDPSQLGSPWGATISSFVSFTLGAMVPVLPYALGATGSAFFLSGALSAFALFTVGSALALLSRKGFLRGGLRMLIIGMATAGVTFGIGSLIGISLA